MVHTDQQIILKEEVLSRRGAVFLLLAALAVKAVFILYIILKGGVGLGPDEAQYWTWSRELAFGYYSKPPAIAWQIWLGTHAFGDTELGVRAVALLIGTLLPLVVYLLARASYLTRMASFWAAMTMAWSPVGVMASFLAITDGGMVLGWSVALLLVARALARETACSYYLLGLCVACGALFKWVMYEFWIPVSILVALFPQWRSRHLAGGITLSLMGLLPSVVWNAGHDWATFRHVGATLWNKEAADTGVTALAKGNFWDFFGAQAVLLSPIIFVLFFMGCFSLWKRRSEVSSSLLFCGCLAAVPLLLYLAVAIFKKMQGNWADFAYPAAAVVVAWRAWDDSRLLRPWLVGGVALSAALCMFAFALPFLQSESVLSIPYKYSPFKHNVGWEELRLQLQGAGYDPDNYFLAADKYQTTSVLSFYGAKQKRAYFFNLQGARKNQFSYWPGLVQEEMGRSGYFVVVENMPLNDPRWKVLKEEYKEKLVPFFADVRFLGVRPLFSVGGEPVKGVMLFKVVDYNGREPADRGFF